MVSFTQLTKAHVHAHKREDISFTKDCTGFNFVSSLYLLAYFESAYEEFMCTEAYLYIHVQNQGTHQWSLHGAMQSYTQSSAQFSFTSDIRKRRVNGCSIP